ncbi:hypothetical protein FOYG_11903 [Fusarium oxysporum NRRL 32931]|uniref:NmrA-like domain-containing protein n=1 Tax=Fusarium oxysporum NRRL 32931 TaxID=660029 RepID=W9HUH4_FUSOX|nr:hypothetical protein FOYG_11903 [Fusarium oxysporum NRRL 32931]
MSKILTVFGATGNQGGSIIRAVLADVVLSKDYKIRGITRDASKPAAKALVEEGVDVVSPSHPKSDTINQADMDSKASLADALKGSHTGFLVTTPDFMSGGGTQEQTHGKNVADVSSDVGVKCLIYSSLLHVTYQRTPQACRSPLR